MVVCDVRDFPVARRTTGLGSPLERAVEPPLPGAGKLDVQRSTPNFQRPLRCRVSVCGFVAGEQNKAQHTTFPKSEGERTEQGLMGIFVFVW